MRHLTIPINDSTGSRLAADIVASIRDGLLDGKTSGGLRVPISARIEEIISSANSLLTDALERIVPENLPRPLTVHFIVFEDTRFAEHHTHIVWRIL